MDMQIEKKYSYLNKITFHFETIILLISISIFLDFKPIKKKHVYDTFF